MDDAVPAGVRIGELSRRVGVEPATLRAWERRYGLPRPGRSRAGQRLYDPAQEFALRRMLTLRAEGYGPQVAARLARDEAAGVRPARAAGDVPGPPSHERGAGGAEAAAGSAAALEAALDGLDARAAHAALDHLLAARGLDLTLRDVVLPLLARIGDRWEAGELTVAQEHFASALLGGRLRALGRSFGSGRGPRAVLACPPGERHELGLLCFALLLHDRGWEVTFLGADTPLDAVTEAGVRVAADLVVLGGAVPGTLDAAALVPVAAARPLALGGRAATPAVAARAGARLLPDDVVAAADALSVLPAAV